MIRAKVISLHLALMVAVLVSIAAGISFAATQLVEGNPLRISIADSGAPAIGVKLPGAPVYTIQYFASLDAPNADWGSVIWLNGTDISQRYSMHSQNYSTAATPVSNTTTVDGATSVITTVVDLGTSGIQVTQKFTYTEGDRFVSKEWTLLNTSGTTTFNDLRFFHGGDSYFGGEDSAFSFYDVANSMVFLRNSNYTDWGIMGFYANPATPASRYFSGQYGTGLDLAAVTAQLTNTVDASFTDAGYQLQWNRAALGPGETWTIQAYEVWTPGGFLQVIAPAGQNVTADSSADLNFTLQNLSNDPIGVTMSTSDSAGWGSALVSGASVTIQGNSNVSIIVRTPVPITAVPNDVTIVTLNAQNTTNPVVSVSAQLTVKAVDMSVTPTSKDFGTLSVGASSSQTFTVTNTGATSITFGNVGSVLSGSFIKGADSCTSATLAAGGECAVEVIFSPLSGGPYNSSLNIPVVAPELLTRTVPVAGSGPPLYAITTTPGANGSLSCTPNPVPEGLTSSCTAQITTAGYHVSAVSGCGINYLNADNGVITTTQATAAVTDVCSVGASFALNSYSVEFASGANGTVDGTMSQTVGYLSSTSTVTAAGNSGFHFVNWTGTNGFITTSSNPLTIMNVTADMTITANFDSDSNPLNGLCGFDNGKVLQGPPVNLCATGAPSAVAGAGPYTWSCAAGFGGTPASCSSSFFALPRTGQTKCYDTYGAPVDCAGTGQDGDKLAGMPWPNPRFTNNNNGTITDNLTGLTWLRNANCMDGTDTWQYALDAVAELNSSGTMYGNPCGDTSNGGTNQTDWRMPNINELESIFNGGAAERSAWLNGMGFLGVQSDTYWSSTSDISSGDWSSGPSFAWVAVLSSDDMGIVANPKDDSYAAWAVRGTSAIVTKTGQTTCFDEYGDSIADCTGTGQDGEYQAGAVFPDPRFTDNGNGTVTDNLTSLIWLANAQCSGGSAMWDGALGYITELNTSGTMDGSNCGDTTNSTDWRLPNKRELLSLVDRSQGWPALPSGHPFFNVQDNPYWTSTSVESYSDSAWILGIARGGGNSSTKDSSREVWAVRSGTVVPYNGVCGGDNGAALLTTPTRLCAYGDPSAVGGAGPWTWSCSGRNGGSTDSCGASIATYTVSFQSGPNGSISGTAEQLIAYRGSASEMSATADGGYHFVNWTGTNGFITTSMNPLTVTNVRTSMTITANFDSDANALSGQCGYDGGRTLTATPINLCAIGLSSAVSGTGPWAWTCAGDTTASCAAEKFSLVRTGQTLCYDMDGGTIDCLGTGQDGEKRAGKEWPATRFTNNSDGSMTDNLTGLVWLQNANCYNGTSLWADALGMIGELNASGTMGGTNCGDAGGNTDWRLPNINEIESLMNAGAAERATWLNDQGFMNTQFGYYWSSTTSVNSSNGDGSDSSWVMDLGDPSNYAVVSTGKTSLNYTWAVRGAAKTVWKTGQALCYDAIGTTIDCAGTGQDGELQAGVALPDPRFTDNSNGTVTDNLTGLVWLKNAQCVGGSDSWSNALAYVNELNGSGTMNGTDCGDTAYNTDWRLPNRKELFSLFDRSQADPAVPVGHPFSNLQNAAYWSSTTVESTTGNAWVGGMPRGGGNAQSKYNSYEIWAVRSGVTATAPVPVNGQCGGDNGQVLAAVAPANLCNVTGAAPSVGGSGSAIDPWLWTCTGQFGGTPDNCTATAQTYTVTFLAGANGTVDGTSPQTIQYGGTGSAVTANANANYHFVNWTGNNGFVTATANPLTVTSVVSSMTITANFATDIADGACGTANNGVFGVVPSANLCSSGTLNAAGVTSSGDQWVWRCDGTGGANADCSAARFVLPRTGQMNCYDQSGTVIACSSAGQDADILAGKAWPATRFTNNSDGTMIDNLTGLVWLRNANCLISSATWTTALSRVAELNASGTMGGNACGDTGSNTDWRLPNVNELESLMTDGQTDRSGWLIAHGFLNVQDNYYWTSTTVNDAKASAWQVNFGDPATYGVNNAPKSGTNLVWAVRGTSTTVWKTGQIACTDGAGAFANCSGSGQDGEHQAGLAWPNPRLTDNTDGTVSDNLTGLVWLKNADCLTSGATWTTALGSVAELNASGTMGGNACNDTGNNTDWRLPNRKEFFSIIDRSQSAPSLAGGYPFSDVAGNYWTATSVASNAGNAWLVGLTKGGGNSAPKSAAYSVWPVRGGTITAVDGACGPNNGQHLSALPVFRCDAGSASALAGTGPWTWSCDGIHGGTTANCSADIQDPPSITITSPGAAEPIVYGNSYTIRWTANDPDSDPTIVLGYDTTGAGCSGTTVPTGTIHMSDGSSHAWDITVLPYGTYYVYAVINDGTTSVCSYGPGAILRGDSNGDIDLDGDVDVLDALKALRITVGLDTATSQQMARGDVAPFLNSVPQPDGKIDIGDVLMILRKTVGLWGAE